MPTLWNAVPLLLTAIAWSEKVNDRMQTILFFAAWVVLAIDTRSWQVNVWAKLIVLAIAAAILVILHLFLWPRIGHQLSRKQVRMLKAASSGLQKPVKVSVGAYISDLKYSRIADQIVDVFHSLGWPSHRALIGIEQDGVLISVRVNSDLAKSLETAFSSLGYHSRVEINEAVYDGEINISIGNNI